jgi:hypothetical protein
LAESSALPRLRSQHAVNVFRSCHRSGFVYGPVRRIGQKPS